MKLEPTRVMPRLNLVSARWQACCGWCLRRSRVVSTPDQREAWNEIASTEGWAVWQPEPTSSGMPTTAYPICLECAEHYATTGEFRSPHSRRRA